MEDVAAALRNKAKHKSSLVLANGYHEPRPPRGSVYTDQEIIQAIGGDFDILPTPAGGVIAINIKAQETEEHENALATALVGTPIYGDVLFTNPVFIRI